MIESPIGAIDSELTPYDYREAKIAVLNASRERRAAESEYRIAIERKASTERVYRKALATEMLAFKEQHGATMAEALAKGTEHVGAAREAATIAEGRVYACLERLRLCSEDRASLHRLIEWSRELAGGLQ